MVESPEGKLVVDISRCITISPFLLNSVMSLQSGVSGFRLPGRWTSTRTLRHLSGNLRCGWMPWAKTWAKRNMVWLVMTLWTLAGACGEIAISRWGAQRGAGSGMSESWETCKTHRLMGVLKMYIWSTSQQGAPSMFNCKCLHVYIQIMYIYIYTYTATYFYLSYLSYLALPYLILSSHLSIYRSNSIHSHIYIYICMHKHMHMHIHIQVHVNIRICTYINI